jgi:ribulose-bisphosphate carboxylase large chain
MTTIVPGRDEVIARYHLRSKSMEKAAEAIAIGQSIGNPNVRLASETNEMWERFGCAVREIRPTGQDIAEVDIGYPVGNLTPSSLTHLLTTVMGGQMDIDIIVECRLIDLFLPPSIVAQYRGPSHGVAGIRAFTGAYDRPLIGGIVKPKTGLTPQMLADVCRQMADGGVDFIKEDEILGVIDICPLEERVEKVMRALEGYRTIFAPAINSPIQELPRIASMLKAKGCKAFHYNVWGGFDAFKYLSDISGLFSFYQKSGDRVMTVGDYSVDFTVWCKLARLAGADFIHAGMMGGYLNESEATLKARIGNLLGPMGNLKSTLASLSCGAAPGMVEHLRERLGPDIMISSGGNLHGHPSGTRAGAKAFRDAAERRSSPEYAAAVAKWGKV